MIDGTALLCCTTQDDILFEATGKTITASSPAPTASTDAPSLTPVSYGEGESSGESASGAGSVSFTGGDDYLSVQAVSYTHLTLPTKA